MIKVTLTAEEIYNNIKNYYICVDNNGTKTTVPASNYRDAFAELPCGMYIDVWEKGGVLAKDAIDKTVNGKIVCYLAVYKSVVYLRDRIGENIQIVNSLETWVEID